MHSTLNVKVLNKLEPYLNLCLFLVWPDVVDLYRISNGANEKEYKGGPGPSQGDGLGFRALGVPVTRRLEAKKK